MKEDYWVSIPAPLSFHAHARNWCNEPPTRGATPLLFPCGFRMARSQQVSRLPDTSSLILERRIKFYRRANFTIAILHDNEAAKEVSFCNGD